MCGRFFIAAPGEEEALDAILREASERQRALTGECTVARGQVFPSAVAAVRARGKNGAVGSYPMQWGFERPGKKGLIINARSETAAERPMFSPSLRDRRCLIPASWYVEWEIRDAQRSFWDMEAAEEETPSLQVRPAAILKPQKGKTTQRIPYAIRPKTDGLIFLAGIYRYEPGKQLPVFTILTREASPDIAFIHPRMPVIFSRDEADRWLEKDLEPQTLLSGPPAGMAYRRL